MQQRWIAANHNILVYLPSELMDCSQVPVGQHFRAAYLESREVVLFDVILCQYPKVDQKPERYYSQRDKRVMSDDEYAELRAIVNEQIGTLYK